MRFRRLDLTRYGIHTDVQIPFGDATPDIHVIIGPNEAGKSTLRQAITDYLFGIHVQTPFAFLHRPQDLAIGGDIDVDGRSVLLQRIKRAKNSVTDAAGEVLGEDLIAKAVASLDRATYERMFGLDLERLQAGGQDILDNRDDASKLLFQAASGLSNLTQLIERLEEEADQLYKGRKSGTRAYYAAQGKLDEAKTRLRQAALRKPEWRARISDADDAAAALREARDAHDRLAQQLKHHQRLLQSAPHLRDRADRMSARAAMGSVVLLPANADVDFRAAAGAIAEAEEMIAQISGRIAAMTAEMQGVVLDALLLSHDAAIQAVVKLAHRTSHHRGDLRVQQAKATEALKAVLESARKLGWGRLASASDVQRRLPSELELGELRRLQTEHASLASTRALAVKTVLECAQDLDNKRQRAHELKAIDCPVSLSAATEDAKSLGDSRQRAEQLRAAELKAEAALLECMARLAPWSGDREALARLPVPDASGAREAQDSITRLRVRAEGWRARRVENNDSIARIQKLVVELQHQPKMVTTEQVQRAREVRDEIWGAVKTGASASGEVEAFEEKVREADQTADLRYEASEQAHQYDKLQEQLRDLEHSNQGIDRQIEEAEGQITALTGEWTARLDQCGLSALSLSAFPNWRQQFELAIHALRQLTEAVQLEADYLRDVGQRRALMAAELVAVGAEPESIARAELPALLKLATDLAAAASKAQGEHAEAKRAIEAAERALRRAEQSSAEATDALERWQQDWEAALAKAGLPAGCSPEAGQAALAEFPRLTLALSELAAAEGRVRGMTQDLDELDAALNELVKTCATDLAGRDSFDAVRVLNERLSAMKDAAQKRNQLENVIAERQADLEQLAARRVEAEARLRPLMEAATAQTRESLRLAIARSDEARALDSRIEAATDRARAAAAGVPLDELEKALGEVDIDGLEVSIRAQEAELAVLAATRDAALVRAEDTRKARDAIQGSADAGQAEADRQMALAEMSGAIERYVEVRTAVELLRWSMNRYRETHKDPLLQRAGAIFGVLTLGEYRRLEVDASDKKPVLLMERNNGKHVRVDELSTGTRDQLFLALRVAALEAHLDGGGARAPFIGDDLFVNYDDQRTAAGFRILGELAQKTQVIYLSHHDHLVDVARGVIGAELNIVRLTAARQMTATA